MNSTYGSIRITISHENLKSVEELFKDVEWYIIYPHKGKNGDNEHFHVLFPAQNKRDIERMRSRAKASGLFGNGCFGAQFKTNSILDGIKYCSHEGTTPTTKGPGVDEWINQAPEWVPEESFGKKRKRDDTLKRLTSFNLLKECWNYRESNDLKTDDLKTVISMMIYDTHDICPTLARNGVPDFYLELFKESVKLGRLKWTRDVVSNLFKPPRQTW